MIDLDISSYSNLMIALVLDVYKNDKALIVLSTNEIDEIDEEFKLKKFIQFII